MKCLFPIADHDVYQFVMPVIRSNMYIVLEGDSALVIDPHISMEAESLLKENHVNNCTILLTHEHFDHISGVNQFREKFDCEVICSRSCGEHLIIPQQNGAAYFSALFLERTEEVQKTMNELINTEYCCTADHVYETEQTLEWKGFSIFLKAMPGHSEGSQIIQIDQKYVFTGDNLIPDQKTITRLPGGSKKLYQMVVVPYLRMLPADCIIYPGHGMANHYMSQSMQKGMAQSKELGEIKGV